MATKTFIEQFVAMVGWEYDEKSAKKAQQAMQKTTEGIGKSIRSLAISIASVYTVKAIGNFVLGTNRATAQVDNLGKSVGVSIEFMDALQGALANSGVGAETAIRSISRLNKNLGEFAISGQERMGRSLRALGIEFKGIKDLAPEDQFAKILDAVQKAPSYQKAMASASAILGEDAYRLIGYLKTTGMSMSELIQKYKDMDLMTDESHAGAQRFTAIWNDLNFVINAVKGTFAGFLGEALAPMIEEFRLFIVHNRELVRSRLKQWAEDLVKSFRQLVIFARDVFSAVKTIIEAFGGLENMLRVIKFALAGLAIQKTAGLLGKIGNALFTTAGRADLMSTALGGLKTAFLTLAALSIDDIMGFWAGKDSMFGRAIVQTENIIDEFAKGIERIFGLQTGTIPKTLIKAEQFFNKIGKALDSLREKLGYWIYLVPILGQVMAAKNIKNVITGMGTEIAGQAEQTSYTSREEGRPVGLPGAASGPGLGPLRSGPVRNITSGNTTTNVNVTLNNAPIQPGENYEAYLKRMGDYVAAKVNYEQKRNRWKEYKANTAGREK